MWTPSALSSEARPLNRDVWRVVEAQHVVSTSKLTDSLAEQALLEQLIEEVKPPLPPECEGLHYLLATPFRYGPYPQGSRFRRAGQAKGAFYASEKVETALAEMAFHRFLFFASSPDTRLPETPAELTAIRVRCAARLAIDLTQPPLDADEGAWTHLIDYGPCQGLADAAREAGVDAVRYRSARDPAGVNVVLLSPAAFGAKRPLGDQTWVMMLTRDSVRMWRSATFDHRLEFRREQFQADERL